MKGIFVVEKNQLGFLDIPEPVPGPFDALVEVLCCGVCNSTDRKILEGEFQRGTYPILLGHESVGRVVAVGEKVKHFQVGQLVLRSWLRDEHIAIPGGRSRWGGFAEKAIVTDLWAQEGVAYREIAHKQQVVPAAVDPVEAVAMITLKETISCLRSTAVGPGQSLAIVGTGPVAQALTMFASLYGISPIVVFGRNPEWRRMFLNLGADDYASEGEPSPSVVEILSGGGFDRAIEAVGSRAALSRCLLVTKPEGRINVYGVAPESEPYLDADMDDPRTHRPRVLEAEAHEELIDWIGTGKVDLSDWISDVLPWEEFSRGFERVKEKRSNKLVLQIAS